MLANTHDRDGDEGEKKCSSPHYNIVVIDPGAQGLVGQDPSVSYDDASFTAQAEIKSNESKWEQEHELNLDFLSGGGRQLLPVQLLSQPVVLCPR